MLYYLLMSTRTDNQLALIIKTKRSRERDLLVTLVTQTQGRLVVAANGVRQLHSRKRAYLQSGNLVHLQLVTTKGLPLLTQATLVADTHSVHTNLAAVKRLLLFLEILDQVLVSEELSPALFRQILYLRELLLQGASNRLVRQHCYQFLSNLGFLDGRQLTTSQSVTALVNQIVERELSTFSYFHLS